MPSQSLYRKWRSQSFADLVGQEPVVRTLSRAVRDGRIAHAYLFCGPRGTGKTSAARLLAKAVNCADPRDGEPCNACLSCREITEGRSPDVIEIDAASNNSVDNIRELRGNVNMLSSGGRYKVYVIDEAHMLSPQAFNALLKTLEEPPPHVIFVLATTEAHKVLPTIVSRCQRFDFRRITRRDIVARLRHVAQGEGLHLDPEAADMLARAAQGGLRDAVSLLDQAMAFCGSDISLEGVRAMLGVADTGAVRTIVEHVAARQPSEALHLINELVEGGADLRQLNSQLGEMWRALVLARAGADVARIMDRSAEEASELVALAGQFSLDELTACARVFAANDTPARGLPVPQLGLELAVLECIGIRQRGGALAAATSAQPARSPAGPAPESRATPAQPPRPTTAPDTRRPSAPPPRPMAVPPSDEVEELDLAALDSAAPANAQPLIARDPAPQPDAAPSGAPASVAPLLQPGEDGDWLRRAQDQWELVKKVCKQKKRTVAALLHSARPVSVGAGDPLEVVLEADYQFHLDKLREPDKRADVEWALEQVLERRCHVRLVMAGNHGPDVAGGPRGSGAAGPGNKPGGGAAPSGMNGSGRSGAGPTPSSRDRASGLGRSSGGQPAAHAANGRNGNGNGTHLAMDAASAREHVDAIGMRDAAARYANGAWQTLAPADVAVEAARAPSSGPALRGDALKEEVLADPVVREIMRAFPAQLLDVRPIRSDE
jgi:DNA polymerase III subunit gamma/tau